MSAAPTCSKLKYCFLPGGSFLRSSVGLGRFWVSGVAGRGLSVIFFLRRHRRTVSYVACFSYIAGVADAYRMLRTLFVFGSLTFAPAAEYVVQLARVDRRASSGSYPTVSAGRLHCGGKRRAAKRRAIAIC